MLNLVPQFSTLRRWTSLSGQVAGLQIVVQGINAITGLILVRYMAKDEYAWFTIASSLLATLNLLADGGVASGITAIGGRIYEQSALFARLLREGLRLSSHLALIGFILAAPLFYGLLAHVQAPTWLAALILMLAGLATWPSITTVLLNVANRLHTRVRIAQFSELCGALSRLVLTGALFASGWLAALSAMMAAVISGWAQMLIIRFQTRSFLLLPDESVSYAVELRAFVRSLYANHIFFCVQAQVATWIIGWLAGSSEVADLGALGRLGVLFTALTAPIHYLAVPAIARLRDLSTLRRRILFTAVLALAVVSAVVAVAWWQPAPFLWILGRNYHHLVTELPLALAAQGITMLASLGWVMLLSRGWARHAWATIATSILGIALGAAFFSLNTVVGMLEFNIVSVIPTLAFCFGVIFVKLLGSPALPSLPQP